MAGGGGTRLWPLSRRNAPKQFLDLGTGKTLIEHVYDRAANLTEPRNIFVATQEKYRQQIAELLPHVLPENVFFEPERRDTTAAFATIAIRLRHLGRGAEPVMHMWADHVFTKEEKFVNDLKLIPSLIEQNPDVLIIVGHTPISPETTLGYMELGEPVGDYNNVFKVMQFKEKPDLVTAEKYITAGTFKWNLGYFSATPDYILNELIRLNPELAETVKLFNKALVEKNEDDIISAYKNFPKMAIDYALIEKTPRIIAIVGDYGWSDIGNWAIVKQVFGHQGDHMPQGHHIHVDSKNNYIYNTTAKAVSMIGVADTIAVITDDAVLITDHNHAAKVKEVVEKLEKDGKEEYL